MIKAVSNVTTSKGADGNPLHRYHVIVQGRSGFAPMFENTEERKYVDQWIGANCTGEATPGGYNTLFFENEDDAILFWMTFK